MDGILNFFDKDSLVNQLNAISFFILLYERFEDLVIETVKDHLCVDLVLDGEEFSTSDDKYIAYLKKKVASGEDSHIPYSIQLDRAIRQHDNYEKTLKIGNYKEGKNSESGQRFRGSLDWLISYGVFSEKEKEYIFDIRKRRNTVVHELFKTLHEGVSESDLRMIAYLMVFHQRINNWSLRNECLYEDADTENAVGLDDVVFRAMFDILFMGKGEEYRDALRQAGVNV